jgi:hypothetical protein
MPVDTNVVIWSERTRKIHITSSFFRDSVNKLKLTIATNVPFSVKSQKFLLTVERRHMVLDRTKDSGCCYETKRLPRFLSLQSIAGHSGESTELNRKQKITEI